MGCFAIPIQIIHACVVRYFIDNFNIKFFFSILYKIMTKMLSSPNNLILDVTRLLIGRRRFVYHIIDTILSCDDAINVFSLFTPV